MMVRAALFARLGARIGGMAALLAGCAMAGLIGQASAETMVEHSSEVRMQLDFVVPAPALAKFLPAGWEPNIATQGPAKDCNVRMIFIDRVDITKPDGSPATPNRFASAVDPTRHRPVAQWSVGNSSGPRPRNPSARHSVTSSYRDRRVAVLVWYLPSGSVCMLVSHR